MVLEPVGLRTQDTHCSRVTLVNTRIGAISLQGIVKSTIPCMIGWSYGPSVSTGSLFVNVHTAIQTNPQSTSVSITNWKQQQCRLF